MKFKPKRLLRKRKHEEQAQKEPEQQTPPEQVPKITNETVAAHREEVLSTARKYIYPLQHSKHKIVLISTALFIIALIVFITSTVLALYRFQSTSTFVYRVTQVVPFPVAKVGNKFVAYEDYLFELRRYMHYYETQQQLDFNTESGQQQLAETKKRMLDKVVNNVYTKELAKKHKISVSNREVDDQINILRTQNRLGGSDKVFEDVLKDFWGWSVDDFKRSLKQELLEQKVLSALDTETHARAQAALNELKAGADFAAVAKKYSEDTATKDNGGEFGFVVDRTNRDLSAQTTTALFQLQPSQYSEIINTGYSLEIVKNIEVTGDKIRGAHIIFNFKDINFYLNELKEQQKTRAYIRL